MPNNCLIVPIVTYLGISEALDFIYKLKTPSPRKCCFAVELFRHAIKMWFVDQPGKANLPWAPMGIGLNVYFKNIN